MNEKAIAVRRAALEARRARLSDAQRAVLERGLAGQGGPAPGRPPCVVTLAEGGAGTLFLVHPAGGDVSCFVPLAGTLAGWAVHGLQTPGLAGEQEAPYSSLTQLAAHFAAAVRQVQPEGPYRLAGWSLGAQVAFELAQQLTRTGAEVAFLGLLDGDPQAGARARESMDGAAFDDQLPWLQGIAEYLERLWGVAVSLDGLGELEPAAQLEAFVGRLAAAPGRAPHGGPGGVLQLRRVLSAYRANLRALMAWEPRVYAGPMTLVLGAEPAPWKAEAREGWGRLSSQPLQVRETPGDHYSLMASPQVEALGALLTSLLSGPGGRS